MSIPHFDLFIGGEFVKASDGQVIECRDPGSGEVVATAASAGATDAERAIQAARQAFDRGGWRDLEPKQRARMLVEVADMAMASAKMLLDVECKNTGIIRYPEQAGFVASLWFMQSVATYVANQFPWKERIPPHSILKSENWHVREPIGVCAAIVPWNFPYLMAVWKITQAILMGNAVVLKTSPETPCSALALAELFAKSSIPAGIVNIITGDGPHVGEHLCASPDVDKISFTGGTQTGRRVMAVSAESIKNVTLELGGKSANIVLSDADMDVAVDGALVAAFYRAGQVCVAGTRLLVPDSLHDQFVEKLHKRSLDLCVGYQFSPKSKVGPLISEGHLARVDGWVEQGKKEGAEVLVGGHREEVAGYANGHYYAPTILVGCDNQMSVVRNEVFGPVLAVLRYRDVDEAVAIANDSDYGLAGGVWSTNVPLAEQVARRLRTGTVWINDYHVFHPLADFGGFKRSGTGRELGPHGLFEYTELKHISSSREYDKRKLWSFSALFDYPDSGGVDSFVNERRTRIVSGPGCVAQLAEEVDRLGCSRAFVVTDKGIMATGLQDRVRAELGERMVGIFDEVVPDPDTTVCDRVAHAVSEARADLLVALGGGSVIDAAKAARIVVTQGGKMTDWLGSWGIEAFQVPLIAIPTTAGTGSEVTQFAVVTKPHMHVKVPVGHPSIQPEVALLDPLMTVGLPCEATLYTGMDALGHAVEAAVSKNAGPLDRAHALHAIRLIVDNLPLVARDGADVVARGRMQTAACMAGIAFNTASLGLAHAMAHPLGSHHGIPHGAAVGIMLPHAMRFNADACVEAMSEVARALGCREEAGQTAVQFALAAADAVSELACSLGHPTSLSEVGVPRDELDRCVYDARLDACLWTNPKGVETLGLEVIASLYDKAM